MVCIVRRCGNTDGDYECCRKLLEGKLYEVEFDGKKYVERKDRLITKNLILTAMWDQIEKEKCAQYFNGVCLSRGRCMKGRDYCYPITIRKKKVNKKVHRLIGYYVIDIQYIEGDTSDDFYFKCSQELIRLIDAYGT